MSLSRQASARVSATGDKNGGGEEGVMVKRVACPRGTSRRSPPEATDRRRRLTRAFFDLKAAPTPAYSLRRRALYKIASVNLRDAIPASRA